MDKRLIVVEDDPAYLALLTRLLSRAGYGVLGAASGEEAIKQLAARSVPLVITDLVMREVDGLALLKFIKESALKTEVIFISGKGTIEVAVEAMRAGAYDFLLKPIADCFEMMQRQKNDGRLSPDAAHTVAEEFRMERRQALVCDLKQYALTKSEIRIVELMLRGGTDNEIADGLFISYHTVRKHIQNLFRKMKIKNRIDLIIQFK